MNVLEQLKAAFAAATPAGGDPARFADAVRPSGDPRFGDYQANGCMALKALLGKNPREIASEVAQRVDLEPLADSPEIAGPGFLNVRLRSEWMASTLVSLLNDEALGVEPAKQVRTIVLDYSSPNVAKPMHVGHIRSTVIGDSLARILTALGHRVIRDNHLGDWGTQFGMIIRGWKTAGDEQAFAADPVGELTRLYRLVNGAISAAEKAQDQLGEIRSLEAAGKGTEANDLYRRIFGDRPRTEIESLIRSGTELAESARLETARLHAGDPENRALWQRFMPYCLQALDAIYHRLGIRFDEQLGESFYDPMLAEVVRDLEARGLAVSSEGATVIFTEETKAPFLIRKRDGAFTYATTDLATIRYRLERWHPDEILYVVDHRQSDHFKQLFEIARRWGQKDVFLEHIAFGTILGADRRPFKTREGDAVGLESLLDEAVVKARAVVDANSPELSEAERRQVAEIVGLGAIKYADLSQNRLSDYVFDWDKMMALSGNTATYMQYAYARCCSILRKGKTTEEAIRSRRPSIVIDHPTERALGLQLLRFPEAVAIAGADRKPNVLTDYLFGLANAFSSFFEHCPVLKADSEPLRLSRLALCVLTARVLKRGLGLLGIDVVDRM